MASEEDEILVVRDNTAVLLLFLVLMAVTMILLSVALVRLGNISRKLDIYPLPQQQVFYGGGGGAGGGDQYFRVV